MSKANKEYEIANAVTFNVIYARLKNLALNMFDWKGLPNNIRPEYIERVLYSKGRALFFEDKMQSFMCLQANPTDGVNVYGEHIAFYGFGYNYNKRYSLDEAVLIRNNKMQTPTDDFIRLYATKLANIERTLDVNINAQKTPFIIACDSNDQLTLKTIYKQIDGNTPVIYADKNLNLNSLEVFLTPAPYVADKLADYRHDVTNEVLTFLGINNANTDKRERLITEEVTANNGFIELNALYMLESRQAACKEINKMFGLNMSVKLKEVERVGEVHDRDKDDDRE